MIKKFSEFLNEEHEYSNECEYCGYEYKLNSDKEIHNDIIKYLQNGYSEAYIEAKIYGKYKSEFGMTDIKNKIEKAKEHIFKNKKI